MSVHSVSIAKYRLKNLLAADRMHCTADLTEQMKNDLYHAVSKYTEINPEDLAKSCILSLNLDESTILDKAEDISLISITDLIPIIYKLVMNKSDNLNLKPRIYPHSELDKQKWMHLHLFLRAS